MNLKFKQADDNDLMPYIGHDFMKATGDYGSEAAWNQNRDFRTLEWDDLDMDFDDNFEDGSRSRSVVSRLTEQGAEWFSDEPKISAQEANEKYGLNGRITFDRDLTDTEAQIIYERKLREMRFQMVANQVDGAWNHTRMFGSGLISALNDPVNIGVSFIPFVGQGAVFLNAIHKASVVGKSLSRVRFALGFKTAAAWTAAFEVPAAAAKHLEKADYTFFDSAANILAGGTLGGTIRAGFPRAYGWFTNLPYKRHEAALRVAASQFAEGKDINVDAIIRAAKNLAKSNPDGRILADIDAASLQRAYNKETGYVPPALPPPRKLIEYEGKTMGEIHQSSQKPNWTMPDFPLRIEDFDSVPTKLGSSEGAVIKHKNTGETWYMKTPKNQEWAASEWVASTIIQRLVGHRGPNVKLVVKNGQTIGIASRWKEGVPFSKKILGKLKKNAPQKVKELRQTAFIHAWLGNRDWAAKQNLIVDRSGNIHSIDSGGSLNFKARGDVKTDFNKLLLTEMISFLDGTNPAIKAILDDMTPSDFFYSIQKLYELSNKELTEMVEGILGHPGMSEAKVREIIAALQSRRDTLANLDNWIYLMHETHGIKVDGNKFPKLLKKAWFYNKDGSYVPSGNTNKIGDNRLKSLGFVADAHQKSRNESFPIRHTAHATEKWLEGKVKKHFDKLTSDELDALEFWRKTGTDDGKLKLIDLHNYASSLHTSRAIGAANPRIVKIYDDLVSAINKFNLDEDITFFSGKSAANFHLTKLLKYGPQVRGEETGLIGKQLNTNTFLNGSFNRTTADMFANIKSLGTDIGPLHVLKDTSPPVMYEVRVPAGQKLALPNAAALRDFAGTALFETEIILPPNTPLHIIDARWIVVPRKGANGKIIKVRTLHIKAEVRAPGEGLLSREAQLSAAHHNFYNNHSNLSAEVKLPPETIKLNRREEILKVEAKPSDKQLKIVTEEVKTKIEDLKALDDQNINDSITRINNELNDTNKFNTLIKKAMNAVKNCVRGKV